MQGLEMVAGNLDLDPLIMLEIDEGHAVALEDRQHSQFPDHLVCRPVGFAAHLADGDLYIVVLEQLDDGSQEGQVGGQGQGEGAVKIGLDDDPVSGMDGYNRAHPANPRPWRPIAAGNLH